MAATCRYFGISRNIFYRWKRRWEDEGLDGLKDRSSAPLHCPTITHPQVAEKIIHLRQHYHFGPLKIEMYLRRYHDVEIAASTIYRILKRLGMNRLPASQRYKRPATTVQVPGSGAVLVDRVAVGAPEVDQLGVRSRAEVGDCPAGVYADRDLGDDRLMPGLSRRRGITYGTPAPGRTTNGVSSTGSARRIAPVIVSQVRGTDSGVRRIVVSYSQNQVSRPNVSIGQRTSSPLYGHRATGPRAGAPGIAARSRGSWSRVAWPS